MGEAVIVSTARTPIGTAFKGTLVDADPFLMAAHVLGEAVQRSGLDPAQVDDVVIGESLYGGGDIARVAAIQAGMEHVPGLAQNRHCATGLSSVSTAAASIRAGMDRVVVAGGTQSTSSFPLERRRVLGSEDWDDWYSPSHPATPDAPDRDMSITVGWNTAVEADISREEMDAWAMRSHERAVASIDAGGFLDEIVPFEVVRRDGTTSLFEVDEHPRRDTSMERLAGLKPLHPEIEGFSVTAGNSSGLNDGAAALVVADQQVVDAEGLVSLATVRSWASVGVTPARTGMAPIDAIPKALERAGLSVDDVDLWEVNEAFASVPVATCKVLGIDDAIVNVQGSGCSLGHPIAMTGARMVMSLVHELRRRGGGTAVAAMCAGGGMGSAVVLEVPAP
jgi:acetyl-CoA acetyltransferase family protein